MKKIVSLIVIVGVLMSFGIAQVVQAKEKVELEWWSPQAAQPTQVAYYDYIIAQFEKKYPYVEIEKLDMIDEDFKISLRSTMAAGIPPDVWFSWGGGILKSYVDAGCVVDLTELLNEPWAIEVIPRAPIAQRTFYGRAYAVPTHLWAGHFFINTDLFDESGIEVPTEPWTWDEFKEAIETFKANGVIPITLGGKEKWELSFYYMYLVDRVGGSEIFTKALNRKPGYSFEDPVFVEAGKRTQELVELGAFQKGFLGAGYSEGERLFSVGEAAMYLIGSWMVSALRASYPEFPLDIIKFPTVPAGKGDPTMLLGGVQGSWAISEASKCKKEAKELFRLLYTPENIIKFAQQTGEPIVFSVELPPGTYDPAIEKQLKDAANASWLQFAYDQLCPPRLASVHLDNVAGLFAGTVTPEEMATAQEECAQELENEGILPFE